MIKRGVLFILLLLVNLSLMAQTPITGVITDQGGQPMTGVTILVKGTTVGALSDFSGKYSIVVPAGSTTLVFSFVGFTAQEVEIAGKPVINVSLAEALTGLNEVVVVGYGTVKKKLVTGATIQVKGDAIQKLSTVSPMTALQGQTPGLSIIKNTGEPGAGFKVNIRGMGTIGNAQPLYVIDGVPGGNIDYLAAADIESIDVLKDAASSAIYGSRGGNGVVLVTTKKGSKPPSGARASMTYDATFGWQNLYKKLPMMNAQEYANILQESRVNSGVPLLDFASLVPNWADIQSGAWKGTDWLGELTVKNAPTTSNAINVFGGGENGNYSLGVSHSSQTGIIGNPVESKYERYTVRLNADYVILKDKANSFNIIKIGETLRYMFANRNGIGTGNQYWNDIYSAIVTSPFLPMWATDKTDPAYPYHNAIPLNPQEANPIGSMVYNRGQNESKNHDLAGSFYLELQPVRNLVYRSQFGYKMSASSYRSYSPIYTLSATAFRSNDQVSHNMSAGLSWTFENTLTYNFKLAEAHSFTVLAGTSAEKWGLGDNVGGTNVNSLFNDFQHAYLDNTPLITLDKTSIGSSPWGEGSLMSYFGRISYSYKEKYMATAILRADGSSNFAPGKRWGYFPSFSAGWVISEEPILQNLKGAIDFLKLRASWGQNGNQDIWAFQYLATISFDNVNYFFGGDKGNVLTGGYPDILPNPDVTWETSDQIDIGFDSRFLGNKLSAEFDWYKKTTIDWLVNPSMLASYGTGAPFVNGGDVTNKGVELALTWTDNKGDFTYSANVNGSFNKNIVTRIDNSEKIFHGAQNVLGQGTEEVYRAQVGFPIGYFWGYKTLGVFQNETEVANYKNPEGVLIMPTAVPGDLKFQDTNNDGVINYNDKVMIGDPNPDYIVGINFSVGFKGFDLSLMSTGAFGQQIARSFRGWAGSPLNNFTTDMFNRWHGEGSSNKYPRITWGSSINWQYPSDIFIENADYLRLSNITFGYDLKRLIKAIPLSQARFFTTVQNLYTFTKYFGMDPEIGTSTTGDVWAKGIDIGTYPAARTFMLGVSLKF